MEPTKVGKAEDDEDAISFVVDFVPFLLVHEDLDHDVGGGGFGGGDAQLEEEGVAFGEGFGGGVGGR